MNDHEIKILKDLIAFLKYENNGRGQATYSNSPIISEYIITLEKAVKELKNDKS